MANYSDTFPSTNGSTTLNGLTWEEKTTSFSAQSNYGYYINTTSGDVTITLPITPTNGTKVSFWTTGGNDIYLTASDKIQGSFLNVDYAYKTTDINLIFLLTFVDTTTGWTWDSSYNSKILLSYIGTGVNLPFTSTSQLNGVVSFMKTINGNTNPYPNNINVTGYHANYTPNPAGLFDTTLSASNGQGVGSLNSNSIRLTLVNHTLSMTKLIGFATNKSTSTDTLSLYGSNDATSWTALETGHSFPWNSGQVRWEIFTVTDVTAYKYFELRSTNSAGGPYYGEIEMFGILIPD